MVVPPYNSSRAPRVPPPQQQAPYPGCRACTERLRRARPRTHPGSVTTRWCTTRVSPAPTTQTGHLCWGGSSTGGGGSSSGGGGGDPEERIAFLSAVPTPRLTVTNATMEGGGGGAGGGISLIGGRRPFRLFFTGHV